MIIIRKRREELEEEAAKLIAESINKLLRRKDKVALALCGGRSVPKIFELLRSVKVDWSKVHIFIVDERLVPIDDPESNFLLAKKSFLAFLVEKGLLPNENIHPFVYSGNIESDLKEYEIELKKVSNYFDIAILSSGEDGHVAALYPNHPTINSKEQYFIYTYDSPKPPSRRMSSSATLLGKTDTCFLLFLGEEKRAAFDKFNDDKIGMIGCPIKVVKNVKNAYVLTDLE